MVISYPGILSIIIAGAVMTVTVTILEGVFGLGSPVIDGAGRSKFYWRWFSFLPKGRRNRIVDNLRLMQVYATIRRYGIDLIVGATPLAGFRRSMQRIIYRDKESHRGEYAQDGALDAAGFGTYLCQVGSNDRQPLGDPST